MKIRIVSLIFSVIIINIQIAYCQTNYEKAFKLGQLATKNIELNHIDEAIVLLEDAKSLDPNNIIYPYELAYAYYIKQNYTRVIKILKKIQNYNDSKDLMFELLGNAYFSIGKKKEAIEVYKSGLIRFPNSGCLYSELGIIELNSKNSEKALSFFEKGICVDPNFASNYYWASKIYFRTSNKLCGLIYGEIFINIERLGVRVEEISEMLYVIFKNSIILSTDSLVTVDFDKNMLYGEPIILSDTLKSISFNMFCKPIILSSIGNEKIIDMNSLDRIKTTFLKDYFIKEGFISFPNMLFDYEYELLIYGHLEAYNHWILKKGNQNEFGVWYENNKAKWNSFLEWYSKNPIQFDEKHKFYSGQYK